MVKIGLKFHLKQKFLTWDNVALPIKKPSRLLGQEDLNKRKMNKVVMQTAEPASTKEDTEKWKNIDITYTKVELEQVAANTTHTNV